MARSPAAAQRARSSSDPEGLRCRRCALSEPRSPSVLAGNPSVGAAGRRRGLPCTTGLLGPLKADYSSQPALGEGRDGHFSGGCASVEGGPYNRGGDDKPWGTFHTLKLGGVLILAFKAHSAGPL